MRARARHAPSAHVARLRTSREGEIGTLGHGTVTKETVRGAPTLPPKRADGVYMARCARGSEMYWCVMSESERAVIVVTADQRWRPELSRGRRIVFLHVVPAATTSRLTLADPAERFERLADAPLLGQRPL